MSSSPPIARTKLPRNLRPPNDPDFQLPTKMPTRSRALPLLGLTAALIITVLFLRWQDSSLAADSPASHGYEVSDEHSATTQTHSATAESKTHDRSPEEEHDYGETLLTLRTIIPGRTEFPEQTLQERILEINAMLKKHDIALRFGVDEILYPSSHLLELKVPAFSKENASPRDILQQDVKAMDKSYFISGDKVLYQDGSGG